MKKLGLTGALALLLSCGSAYANERNDYAALGYTHYIDGPSVGLLTAKYGYELRDTFFVEGRLSLGVKDESYNESFMGNSYGWKSKVKYLVGVYAVKTMPLNERFELYGKAGLNHISSQVKGYDESFSYSATATSTKLAVGGGLNYELSKKSAVNVELFAPSVGDFGDLTEFSVGYLYRF